MENYRICVRSVKKQILDFGTGMRKPTDGSICTVALSEIVNEKELSSTFFAKKTLTFTLGDASTLVDRIVEYCVQSQFIGEKSNFSISCPYLSLSFTVKLDDCNFYPYVFHMTGQDKFLLAKRWKELGVTLFKAGNIEEAFVKFVNALQYATMLNTDTADSGIEKINEAEDIDVQSLLVNLYNNLAQCHLIYQNYDLVEPICSKSVTTKPNVKGYYRRALVFIERKEYEKAKSDLLECMKFDENSKIVREKLELVRSLDETNQSNYKKTIKRMFQ